MPRELDASSGACANHKMVLELSYNTLDVPPEIWEHIATFASRQSVARLCSLSHAFCSVFSVLLYSSLVNPPLTASQSSRLIETLTDGQTSRPDWKPHPATLIRQLRLTGGSRLSHFEKTPVSINALRTLARAPLGSALRVLHWNLAAGIDELGRTLGVPGNFPNVKEIVVSSKGFNTNFNASFVQIRGLEVLGLDLDLSFHEIEDNYSAIGNKLCYKLAEVLQMLPSASPLLHTLRLDLIIPLNDEAECPWKGYEDLISDINLLHLPALTTLDLAVNLDPTEENEMDPDDMADADFFPFLSLHPKLLDLTLDAPGTALTNDPTFLPCLRFFKGSLDDAAVVCACRRQLNEIVLKFVERDGGYTNFDTLPLPTHLSLTKLRVQAVYADGKVVKNTDELRPASLAQLVSSFPNLTHLDICIESPIPEYRHSLVLLTKLQSLRFQEYRETNGAPRTLDVKKLFPPSGYIEEFSSFLPSLPQLAHIEICVMVDTVQFFDRSSPQMTGYYNFAVRAGKAFSETARGLVRKTKSVASTQP
ncbi:hypothetical protein B0H17DRAFT_1096828 [Mycena rosella]|uniref:F-box domain-containing protein n=1 Tax=Mycena rosella TaxID=1033263 RepID=A0AAD7CQN8_MYCRO|nr:hypothetical protein B0H17DRAFT_1096828 [Mycena rosella]